MSIEIKIGCLQTPKEVSLDQIEKAVRADLIGEIPEDAEMLDLGDLDESLNGKKARMGPSFVTCDEYPRRFEVAIVIREVSTDGTGKDSVAEPSTAGGSNGNGASRVQKKTW